MSNPTWSRSDPSHPGPEFALTRVRGFAFQKFRNPGPLAEGKPGHGHFSDAERILQQRPPGWRRSYDYHRHTVHVLPARAREGAIQIV